MTDDLATSPVSADAIVRAYNEAPTPQERLEVIAASRLLHVPEPEDGWPWQIKENEPTASTKEVRW